MKILLLNYHYFVHGGPDRYFFNIKAALERAGHEIVPFAFNYEETWDTPYRKYFPEPITGRAPYLSPHAHIGASAKALAATRLFWNREAAQKFRAILRDHRPGLVYSIYLSSSFLPQLLRIAKVEFELPVLYRLSDFHMLCGSYLFSRNGGPCTACLKEPFALVRYRCMQGSLSGSLLRFLQMKYIRWRGWYECVDYFLCPSAVMRSYLVQYAHLPERKVLRLPTFARDIGVGQADSAKPYVLFLGNITEAKGCEVLLRAYNALPAPQFIIKMVGAAKDGYQKFLLSLLDDEHKPRVHFEGHQQGEAVWEIIRRCLFMVHPALWMENMPNAVLEGMSAGKAILASNLGSLPELVRPGENGRLVAPGSVEELSAALASMACDPNLDKLGQGSREIYMKEFTEALHMQRLLKLMEEVRPG